MLSAEQNSVQCPLKQQITAGKTLKWTFSKAYYVELIYALHEILNMKGGKITLKALFDTFNSLFGMEEFNYSHQFQQLKEHKRLSQTPLLDLLKQLLLQKMEAADEKQQKK